MNEPRPLGPRSTRAAIAAEIRAPGAEAAARSSAARASVVEPGHCPDRAGPGCASGFRQRGRACDVRCGYESFLPRGKRSLARSGGSIPGSGGRSKPHRRWHGRHRLARRAGAQPRPPQRGGGPCLAGGGSAKPRTLCLRPSGALDPSDANRGSGNGRTHRRARDRQALDLSHRAGTCVRAQQTSADLDLLGKAQALVERARTGAGTWPDGARAARSGAAPPAISRGTVGRGARGVDHSNL